MGSPGAILGLWVPDYLSITCTFSTEKRVKKEKERSGAHCSVGPHHPRVAWNTGQAQSSGLPPLLLGTSQGACAQSGLPRETGPSGQLAGVLPAFLPWVAGTQALDLHLHFDVWFSAYVITLIWIFKKIVHYILFILIMESFGVPLDFMQKGQVLLASYFSSLTQHLKT